MVLKLRVRPRVRIQALVNALLTVVAGQLAMVAWVSQSVQADELRMSRIQEAQMLFDSGKYFQSARYAFAASKEDPASNAEAYSLVARALSRARLYQSASYFFIRTLQTGNKTVIRKVLAETEDMLVYLGPDILRRYLIQHTSSDDYDIRTRSAYFYALGKANLLAGQEEKAIAYLSSVSSESLLWPFALQLRGSANAILEKNERAISDFQACSRQPGRLVESADLKARCIAGEARTLYQMERFAEADRTYDRITKFSIVWPEILFEQAWNAFGRQEYNKSLGKLVSYKSPALKFVFNTEVDVLRAQSYLALCLYSDANDVINEFNGRYTKLGEELKRFVETNASDLSVFYKLGRGALEAPLHTSNDFYRVANRFVRAPYFQNLVAAERKLNVESAQIKNLSSGYDGSIEGAEGGFAGFLEQVLQWRTRSIRLLGGAFVKNSLMDYHSALISDFEKMAFIKLEMLGRAKDKLMSRRSDAEDRSRGNVEPVRRDDQYYWSFNGEFWNDELGDYVFGLESECKSY